MSIDGRRRASSGLASWSVVAVCCGRLEEALGEKLWFHCFCEEGIPLFLWLEGSF